MSAKPLHPALTQFTPRHFLRAAPRIPWRRHHANRQLPAGAALGVFVLLKNRGVIVRACACVCVCAVEKERAFWISLWAALSDLHGSFFFSFFPLLVPWRQMKACNFNLKSGLGYEGQTCFFCFLDFLAGYRRCCL